MDKPLFERVSLLGLGLIGSSLARAMREKKLAAHLAAYDVSAQALAFAATQGFIDSRHESAAQAVAGADLVVLAVPPSSLQALAAEIAPQLKKHAVVTDVASVKRRAIAAVLPRLPAHAHFVPAHPIAGSEKTGTQAGRADLFAGKCVVLSPEEKDVMSPEVAGVRRLWEGVGARIEYMPAELHDRIYAYVSHLPQLVAFAAGTGRLAHSNPDLWADICLHNGDYVAEALGDFLTFGAQISGELSESPGDSAENPETAAMLFPKLLAACLIATASLLQEQIGIHPARYAGGGFAEMTAPAQGDPQAVLLAVSEQPGATAALLQKALARLQRMQDAAQRNDRAALVEAFRQSLV